MCEDDLQIAKQLLELAKRYLARGDMAEAAHAMAQADEIVTEIAKRQATEDSQN
jgi:hypothetical protein